MSGAPQDAAGVEPVSEPEEVDSEGFASLADARTYGEALQLATTLLRTRPASPSAATPVLDAQVLLAHITGATRAVLLAFLEHPLSPEEAARYAELVGRRLAGEPVAYLVGHREFLGLDLKSDQRALIPRPESELLVEAALIAVHERLALQPAASLRAADIGTGTGAIALALAAREPRLGRIYAVDLSAGALALARENAQRLDLAHRVRFLQGDLLAPLPEPVDLLLANLPYIAPREAASLPEDVGRYEPALALYADEAGLALLRRFFAQAPQCVCPGGLVGVEFGFDQRDAVEVMARAAFPGATIRVGADYAGWDRFLLAAT